MQNQDLFWYFYGVSRPGIANDICMRRSHVRRRVVRIRELIGSTPISAWCKTLQYGLIAYEVCSAWLKITRVKVRYFLGPPQDNDSPSLSIIRGRQLGKTARVVLKQYLNEAETLAPPKLPISSSVGLEHHSDKVKVASSSLAWSTSGKTAINIF